MQKQYETISSRELRSNPAAAMQKADAEPVVILSGSTPRAVMVSFEQWNTTAARLAYLERVIMGLTENRLKTCLIGMLACKFNLFQQVSCIRRRFQPMCVFTCLIC